MTKDEEAAQALYNARDLVTQRLIDLNTMESNSQVHASLLNQFVHYLLESLPYIKWL
ncbi:hypothetical protein B5807_09878 [Epicoccum nigrum]|uniref:Uncharacterized protein n=1 Tax=Epicoccum nigrum TaxID=105696 RepID=A0A1Y2LTV8_EPING|nr:hypothetical protein B5807_09878 [Epicoccum nigrum]